MIYLFLTSLTIIRIEIIKQMKDQVPVVLLNQWLEIQPEKSGFAKNDNCLLNADEYSVYSDETLSQALSFKAPKVLQDMAKRKSMMMANNNHIKDVSLRLLTFITVLYSKS